MIFTCYVKIFVSFAIFEYGEPFHRVVIGLVIWNT